MLNARRRRESEVRGRALLARHMHRLFFDFHTRDMRRRYTATTSASAPPAANASSTVNAAPFSASESLLDSYSDAQLVAAANAVAVSPPLSTASEVFVRVAAGKLAPRKLVSCRRVPRGCGWSKRAGRGVVIRWGAWADGERGRDSMGGLG